MKIICSILLIILMIGCHHKENQIIEKTLVSNYSLNSCKTIENVIIDQNGVLEKSPKMKISKWKINPNSPLKKVAEITGEFTDRHCIDLYTTNGKFIVLSPAYGQRRLPQPGKDLTYRFSVINEQLIIERNGVIINKNTKFDSGIKLLFKDISKMKDISYVNVFFEFEPHSKWKEAEYIIENILPDIDLMRGLWLGLDRNGQICLHFHDIWKDGWQKGTSVPKLKIGGSDEVFSNGDETLF